MAELTQEDQENYGKLQEAFKKLPNYNLTPSIPSIESITKSIKAEIAKDLPEKDLPEIGDTIELRRRIDLVDSYLKFHAFLLPGNSADVVEIIGLKEQIDNSLKVVEDETLDLTEGIEDFQPDSLFFEFITVEMPKEWTKELINDLDPLLKEDEIEQLTDAWETAVTVFVDDARKKNEGKDDRVIPLQPETFAHFFRIQKELEVLYSRLADSETVRES